MEIRNGQGKSTWIGMGEWLGSILFIFFSVRGRTNYGASAGHDGSDFLTGFLTSYATRS